MNSNSNSPTLGQIVIWTAIFYACFGILVGVLGWFVSTASANILLDMLGLNIPGWAAGWFFLAVSIPVFSAAGAISGLIVYKPIKAVVHFLQAKQEAAS